MHILIFPSWYKTEKDPFLGTFFEEQARGLMHSGHKVGILHPVFIPFSSLFNLKPGLVKNYNDDGLPTYSAFIQSMLPNIRTQGYRQFCKAVEKIFNDYIRNYGKPDIIHAHSVFYAGVAAFQIARKYDIPFIITEHLTSFVMGSISHFRDLKIARDIFLGANASIIVSSCFRRDLSRVLQLDESLFRVIPNMVNDIFFEDRFIQHYRAESPFILFTNSFLVPRKNHRLIFNAVKILLERKKNIRLLVGGNGELTTWLRQMVVEMGIDNQVEFLGGLTRLQVKEHILRSHAFVLSSFYETFGVVLIESLAAGRPVITTNSGGPEDIVNPNNGVLLKDFNPQTMAHALENMMNKYTTYNQDLISKECHEKYCEKVVIRQLEEVYDEVLSQKKAIV